MTTIEMYTRPGCGYCRHAKQLLSSKGLPFVEYDVYQNPQYGEALRSRTEQRTYPQLFINRVSVGGFDELLALEAQNRLPRVNAAAAVRAK
ncbi:MAG: glutaredoxin domain-containing protein [Candidatus Reddybacter sp.]